MKRIVVSLAFLALASFLSAAELPREIAPHFQPPKELSGFGKYRSLLTFDDGTPVKTPADWAKRRQEILRTWHGFMGPWPALIERPKVEYLTKEPRENFTQCHVKIEIAPDKLTDDAYLLIPPGKGPFPAVLVVYYDGLTGIGQGKNPLRDFAYQLARRGFVALSIGSPPASYYPSKETCKLQPLSYHAYVAANCYNLLASLPQVDAKRIGVVGHSYGGKWSMFAGALDDRFACVVTSDPGIVFDEKRSNVNYWEPWYLGFEPGVDRKRGIPTADNPRTGPYKSMIEKGHDLHELMALIAPRPFLVSGGAEDQPERWLPLNRVIEVNSLLGYKDRVAMTNRPMHGPTEESNGQIYAFFEHFLK